MDIIISIIRGILEQGFIYGIMALGIYITYCILNFPDLSVDGTFPLGAAVTALLLSLGINPWMALIAAFICGAMAGFVTGIFHVKLHITDLLSGILTSTALYSVNLMIVGGTALLSIVKAKTIFNSGLATLFPESFSKYVPLIIIFILAVLLKLLLDLYLKTRSGMLLRATGDNETMVTSLAKDSGSVKIVGLMIANGLVATAGSVLCQQQRYFEISMGTGMLVMGVASVIIGMALFGKVPFIKPTLIVILGAVIYRACLSIAINLGINPNNLKLLMTLIFLAALISRRAIDRRGGVTK